MNVADPLSRLLQADNELKASLANKISSDFVRFVVLTATPSAMTKWKTEEMLPDNG
mgnify:CR=1 FL=1